MQIRLINDDPYRAISDIKLKRTVIVFIAYNNGPKVPKSVMNCYLYNGFLACYLPVTFQLPSRYLLGAFDLWFTTCKNVD
jgi:hypothetical protein